MPLGSDMDLNDEDIEALRTVANADCSASWIAQTVLKSEGYSSYSVEKSNESHATANTTTHNEREKGILAY